MRYLLDTATVSELRRDERRIHSGVKNWQTGIGEVWLSVITLNELRYGMRKVASRDPEFSAQLAGWYNQLIAQPQKFHIISIDRVIAEQAADFRAAYNTPFEDSLIAATAKVYGLTLTTRNTADFEATGVSVVNPWETHA